MSLFQAIVLGIVQGITEFLPVSSTAHLRIVPALLGWSDPGAAYTAIIQLGTLGAVFVYFARDLWGMTKGFFEGVASKKILEHPQGRLALFVLVGTVPIGIAGMAFKHWIEHEARSLYVISGTLIVVALILLVADLRSRRDHGVDKLSFGESQVIGLAQTLALIPGVSRSGITITAGLGVGLTRDAAARFSFLLSVPAVAAAAVFELRSFFKDPHSVGVAPLVVGTASAFVFGLLAIGGLLRFLRTRSMLVFVIYRLIAGTVLAVLTAKGIAQ